MKLSLKMYPSGEKYATRKEYRYGKECLENAFKVFRIETYDTDVHVSITSMQCTLVGNTPCIFKCI